MKKRMVWSLLLLPALLLAAGGCGQQAQEEEAEDTSVAVEIQPVERGTIAAESSVSGQVAAGDQESVFVGLSAQCTDVFVEVGDTVSSGQALFTLDISSTLDNIKTTNMSMESARKSYQDQMSLLNQQIKQASDQKAQATSQMDQANSALEQANSAVEQANSQLEAANNQLAMAEKALSDTEALLAIGAASQLEVDQAKMTVDNAKMGVQSAEMGVESAKMGVDNAQSGVESARLGVDNVQLSINNLKASQRSAKEQYNVQAQNSQATLNQLNASLRGVDRNGRVSAPISGTVIALNAYKNGYASPGTPMVTIESTTDREISAAVSETLVPKISVGGSAGVVIEAAGVDFQGTITSIDTSANPATHLYGVTIAIPADKSQDLLAGMFAEVTFYTDTQNDVVVIPTEAIQTGVDGSYVFILDSENIAHRVTVETGLVGNGVTEITSGLAGGESLVTVGQFYLADGVTARVVPHQGGES